MPQCKNARSHQAKAVFEEILQTKICFYVFLKTLDIYTLKIQSRNMDRKLSARSIDLQCQSVLKSQKNKGGHRFYLVFLTFVYVFLFLGSFTLFTLLDKREVPTFRLKEDHSKLVVVALDVLATMADAHGKGAMKQRVLSRDEQLKFLSKLLTLRGQSAAVEINQRIKNGTCLEAKGIVFDVSVLQEALQLWTLSAVAEPQASVPVSSVPTLSWWCHGTIIR